MYEKMIHMVQNYSFNIELCLNDVFIMLIIKVYVRLFQIDRSALLVF